MSRWLVTIAVASTCLACGSSGGSASPPADGSAPPGDAGQGPGDGPSPPDAAVDCSPNDGVQDPPCAAGEQMRCNGKCFANLGECKAGCWLVGSARNTRGILFENGFAYNYNASTLTSTNLSTYKETRLASESTASFSVAGVVVKNGVLYAIANEWVDKADPGATVAARWTQAPGFLDGIAIQGDTLYLLDSGLMNLYALSIPTQSVTALTGNMTYNSVFGVGYDDTWLYWTGRFGATNQTGTYKAAAGGFAMSQQLSGELMTLGGPIYGNYLYDETNRGLSWLRMPKSGGATQSIVADAGAMPFPSTTASGDAFYVLDAAGQVHRLRSATDDDVVARVDATQAMSVGSDGTYAYVATGLNSNGGLFRILEP